MDQEYSKINYLILSRSSRKDTETASALAEVGGGISGSVEGIDAVLERLQTYIPHIETDDADTVWTVDSLLTQLVDEAQENEP